MDEMRASGAGLSIREKLEDFNKNALRALLVVIGGWLVYRSVW